MSTLLPKADQQLDSWKFPKAEDGTPDYSQDFFRCAAYLTVSGQLQGEAFASALVCSFLEVM